MSQFTEERVPYEFLVRWDENGNIKGAHVRWLGIVKKNGEILTQKPSNAESVSIGIENGFPLDELLNNLQIDILKEFDSLKHQLFQKEIELISVKKELKNYLNQ